MARVQSPRSETLRRAAGSLGILDWIRIGVLAVGVVFVATGLLPPATARASVERIAPLLLFLFSVIILAELTKEAGVFDAIAQRMARAGRGNYAALFLLCVAFASLTTIFLNLDTTAVLLTPVMLALAARARIATLPLAMTTVWLANTASLLLPVSNLTNLLAADRVALQTRAFAARMWAPQLAVLAVTMVLLWWFYWRRRMRGEDAYEPPARRPSATGSCSPPPGRRACCSSGRSSAASTPGYSSASPRPSPPPWPWPPSPCATGRPSARRSSPGS